MTIYSAFSIPTLGMMGQSHALATIGNNIANVTTGGFKRTDTNFSTLLSQTLDKQSDIGGMKPKDLNQITQLGNMVISNRDLDLAINGQGFFVLNSDLTGGGETYYGRDGSFEMATVNDISVTADDGSTITTKDGYLVDKNGYYLQGWTADPVTGLFGTTLSALRIDPYAFAAQGQTTTNASLRLNLPATDEPGLVQVTEVALSGTIEANDTYDVTVDGTTVSYTATGLEASYNVIRDALVTALNANAAISAVASAEASPTDGKLLVKGLTQGTAITVTSSSTNVAAGIDDTNALGTTVQSASTGDVQYYNIEVFDSNGNARSPRLDFTKTSNNTWDFSTTVGLTPVAQVDTVTLAGTIEAGDVYTVNVEGNAFSHTVLAADTLSTIRDSLVNNINLSSAVQVTAAASGTDALTLTADTAGTSFTSSASTTNRTPVAQVDNVTLTGTYAAGDTISVTINGTAVNYTVDSTDMSVNGDGTGGVVAGNSTTAYNNITTKLAAAINANGTVNTAVTAAATGGGGGVITITSDNAGTAFTNITSATLASSTSTASTPTANVVAVAQVDNVTMTGTFAPGEDVSVNVNGIGAVTYTVIPADLTDNGADGSGADAIGLNNIAIKLAAAVVGDAPTAAVVTAAAPGGGVVSLTAVTAGTAFANVAGDTAAAGAATGTTPTANVAAVAQIDNATLTGTYGVGDVISIQINALTAVTYTVIGNDLTADGIGGGGTIAGNSAAAYNNITTKIAAAINGDVPTAAIVTAAAPGGGGGVVTITADAAGTAFAQVTSATEGGSGVSTASAVTANLVAVADNTATQANTVANVAASETTTTAVSTLTFNDDGSLATPATGSVTLNLSFPAVGTTPAGTATVTLDINELSQFAGAFQPFSYSGNGFAASNAQSIKFDTSGQVLATFDDGSFRAVYKIPLAQFSNANALHEYAGNVYQETAESGSARVVDVSATGYASFLPNTHELSNVDLADEFTRMMMTQTAYNSSATVFKTVDEMTIAARDLKR